MQRFSGMNQSEKVIEKQEFIRFLEEKRFEWCEEAQKMMKFVDIDGDGMICEEDLEQFIKRFSLIEYAKSEMTHSVCSYQTSIKGKTLYP